MRKIIGILDSVIELIALAPEHGLRPLKALSKTPEGLQEKISDRELNEDVGANEQRIRRLMIEFFHG